MRILLLHLDPARGEELAESMREDGHEVTWVADAARPEQTPDVIVVCPESSPQRTLDLAARLGADSNVQAASILFVGGTPAALAEAQRRFPKASFARLDALATALASMES